MRHIPLIWEYVALKSLEISSISVYELIVITAHYTSLISNEIDHDESLKLRGFSEEQIKKVSKQKPKTQIKTMGLIFKQPLCKFKYPLIEYVLILSENYEKGNLPFSGSISEQPAQVIEILELIKAIKSNYLNTHQNKRT